MILTIGRQYGSGGREIGQKLAELLGYKFYDSEILAVAAESSGYSEGAVSQYDEKPGSSLIYSLYMSTTTAGSTGDMLPMNQKLAFAQFDAIRTLAREDNCVFVGRCADYVLKERKDLVSIFIHASPENRRRRAVDAYGVAAESVDKVIKKQDKQRKEYYNFFTHRDWGAASNYDLCIHSDFLGIEGTVEVLATFVRYREKMLREGIGA